MPMSLIPSFLFYIYINGITPGPANVCSLAAAISHGKNIAIRQWWGLLTGFTADAMIAVVVTYFAGSALGEYVKYMSYVGAAYIIWIAIHLLKNSYMDDTGNGTEYSFKTGLILQLTNPKVILMCFTALGTFVLPYTNSFVQIFIAGCVLPLSGPICNLVWLFSGVKLRKLFRNHRKKVNIVMSAALIACAVSLILN